MNPGRLRLLVFSLLILGSSLVLAARLFQLQILHGAAYADLSEGNFNRRQRLPAPRGRILDRNGVVLAENVPDFQLVLNLPEISNPEAALRAAAYLLEMSPAEVQDKIAAQASLPRHDPRVLAEDLNRAQWARLLAKISAVQSETGRPSYDLSGLHPQVGWMRTYPMGAVFGHLLGYLRQAGPGVLKSWEEKEPGRLGPQSLVGIKGVEKTFDERLRGRDGYQKLVVDARGRAVDLEALGLTALGEEIPPRPGADLRLTVDARLNLAADRAFGDRVGALVALDPQNGEILAWLSKPSYDPDAFSQRLPPERWARFRDHPDNILLNRPIQGAYPPGSTYKIVTAVAALAEGKIDFKEKINCPGYYTWGGRKWGCWRKSGHGAVNLVQALKQSCDVFFYKLGERLGPDKIAKYAKLLGLGEKTQVLSDDERSGLIPTADWKEKHTREQWKNSDNLGNAIGQGFNLVTPLQSALMVARFANGGKFILPHLISNEGGPGREPLGWGLTTKEFNGLKEALHQVVDGEGGTGRAARVPGVTVGGKTGTAQVVSLDYRGAAKREDHAWFVAFAPVEQPQIAVAVLVEHGGGGGKVAAPIAQKVLEEFFREKGGEGNEGQWE